jgi:hypothetical protein
MFCPNYTAARALLLLLCLICCRVKRDFQAHNRQEEWDSCTHTSVEMSYCSRATELSFSSRNKIQITL